MTRPTDADKREAEPFLRHHPRFARTVATESSAKTAPETATEINPIYPWVGDQLDLPDAISRKLASMDMFSVLLIKTDTPAKVPNEALHKAVLQLFETREAPFFGGHWRENLYVGLLPDTDSVAADAYAHAFQSKLSQMRPEPISIGISTFPLLDYSAPQAVANSGKAMDHAAFFGPGSIVVFDAVSLNISADHYYQAGDMDEAIAQYRAAMQLDPTNANVLNSLGVCLAHQGDLAGARNLFASAWKNDATEAMAIYNLAMIQLLEGTPQEALPLLKQAYALDTTCFDIPFQIGKLLYAQQAFTRATPYFNSAVALQGSCAVAHYYLGACLARTAQPKAAIEALTRAIKLNPNDASALSTLGALYSASGENPDVCETFFQQSISLAPQEGRFHQRLGRFYQKHGQWDQAMTAYQNAEALGRNCSELLDKVRSMLNVPANDDARCA